MTTPVPRTVTDAVERYVADELADATKYDNRSPLDEGGIWALHELAAEIYASGFSDGRSIELIRANGRKERNR